MQRVIPTHLLEKLNRFGRLALQSEEIKVTAKELAQDIYLTATVEGFTVPEIRDMFEQQLKNSGLPHSYRTILYALPDSLKDKKMQNLGRRRAEVEAEKKAEEKKQLPEQPAPRTIADIVTPKEDGESFPYLEGKVKMLQAKVNELEAKKEAVTVRIMPSMFAKVFSALKTNMKYVELTADENGQVVGVEGVRA